MFINLELLLFSHLFKHYLNSIAPILYKFIFFFFFVDTTHIHTNSKNKAVAVERITEKMCG